MEMGSKVVVDLTGDDDGPPLPAAKKLKAATTPSFEEQLAERRQRLQAEKKTTTPQSSPPSSLSTFFLPGASAASISDLSLQALLDADCSVDVLRCDPTPILILHTKQRGGDFLFDLACRLEVDMGSTAQSALDGKFKGSMRKCGAAQNSGGGEASANGKNCDDSYILAADSNPRNEDPNKLVLSEASLADWHDHAVQPLLEFAAQRVGGSNGSAFLLDHRPAGFRPSLERTGETRLLKYEGPRNAETRTTHQVFHRHHDHGFYGLTVLASFGLSAEFFIRVSPGDERVVHLAHGDVLVFDAARESDVFHGVDAILKTPGQIANLSRFQKEGGPMRRMLAQPSMRVSLQYRIKHPAKMARIQLSWMARNLYSFEEPSFAGMRSLIGLPPATPAHSRLQQLQQIVERVAGPCYGADCQAFHLLFEAVQTWCVINGNESRYLSGEIFRWKVGGHRPHFVSAWHIDKDCSDAAWKTQIRVDLPLTAAAATGKLCSCPAVAGSGKTASLLTVKKQGPNTGRNFWACAEPQGSQCGFFEWADGNGANKLLPPAAFISLPM